MKDVSHESQYETLSSEITITVDEKFKSLIPPLSAEERAQLEQNIAEHGCRDPLVVWPLPEWTGEDRHFWKWENATRDGTGSVRVWPSADGGDDLHESEWPFFLIDGHNRYEICTRLGIPFDVTMLNLSSRDAVEDWMDANQLGRRNLVPDMFRMLLGRRYNRAKKGRGAPEGNANATKQTPQVEGIEYKSGTAEKLAEQHGVSRATVERAGKFAEEVDDYIAKNDEKSILEAAKKIRAEKAAASREERLDNIANISAGNAELDTSVKYPVIYADPPWRYENAPMGGANRAIENQYPTMSLEEICDMPVSDLAHDDAILYMWTTAPKLEESFKVINAWGFSYRTHIVWDKEKIGMGYHARSQHELLLICTRGKIPPPKAGAQPSSVHREARGKHSAKPNFYYEMIEGAYPQLGKIELFCRSPRDGWAVWGNQSKGVAA